MLGVCRFSLILLVSFVAWPKTIEAQEYCPPLKVKPPRSGSAQSLPTDFLVQDSPGDPSLPQLVFAGDSLVGGLAASDKEDRVAFKVAQSLPGTPSVTALSLSGRDSTYISKIFQRKTKLLQDVILIIWVGRNNFTASEQVLFDIKAMIEHAKTSRFLVLSVPPSNDPEEYVGSERRRAIDSLNHRLSEEFGDYFIRVGTRTDCADRADNVHFTAGGQAKIAAEVADALKRFGWFERQK
ncbi:SGNH/GDSL hydrolase family protein [Pseudorhizobium pelagicum]|uniref:SGNH/GDSL hydrolase family protein n=1 Tax=Pseudorhizobium pelagicum TaxID=1509405 RepID=UPI0011111E28|nr:SGNH/GDSL hydrolase family protein [Pseudorhizobium pelagicum]